MAKVNRFLKSQYEDQETVTGGGHCDTKPFLAI